MKKQFLILMIAIYSCAAHSQNSLNVGIGGSPNFGLINGGFDFTICHSWRVTPELISMIPHTRLSTLWGVRAGYVIQRFCVQAGYYFNEYSADKNEYTAGKNFWVPGAFVSYDVLQARAYRLSLQAAYIRDPQFSIILKTVL